MYIRIPATWTRNSAGENGSATTGGGAECFRRVACDGLTGKRGRDAGPRVSGEANEHRPCAQQRRACHESISILIIIFLLLRLRNNRATAPQCPHPDPSSEIFPPHHHLPSSLSGR
ncbi:hypothetical protein B0I35DRAFT_462678 [Stachybotrys elegans]|uniref:Uncharacterized protein n=1 Tax=Stachybotrys elegans TaxID=80388 RepID=A0A8K0SKJ1_9HYPO|nr:hypothetical protein B0I35DRAFT_462678 [Stachybotrys elegans]